MSRAANKWRQNHVRLLIRKLYNPQSDQWLDLHIVHLKKERIPPQLGLISSVPRLSSQSSWNGWGSKRQVAWPLRGENRGLMGLVSHRVSLRYSLWLRGWPKAAEDRVIKELWKPVDQWLMRKAPVGSANASLLQLLADTHENPKYPSLTNTTQAA